MIAKFRYPYQSMSDCQWFLSAFFADYKTSMNLQHSHVFDSYSMCLFPELCLNLYQLVMLMTQYIDKLKDDNLQET